MKNSRILTASLAAVSLLTVSACVTDPNTGERKVSRTVLGGAGGAVAGGLLGGLIGGKTGRIIGAAAGGIGGGVIGYKMDQQIKELEEQTAGTGVDVIRDGDNLLLRMPSGITFGYDRADVQPQFQPTLNEVSSVLAQYPKTYIDIYGHTDSDGSDAYNQTLSERRAQSVATYLVGRGVQSARIGTRGFGEPQPIASNATEEGKAANRRVEIKIAPVTEADVQG